ncbi:GRIN2-like protein [Bombina bombina]|uniref:GRIN2-like protein n=1 Tax=Bombina bombina TaxID=8345 RepID=UPI00235ACB29|nr:GRIN2-like protein [Bombina bombina]
MANRNHRLSTHSYQETLNVNSFLGKSFQDCPSISKSSSALQYGEQGSSLYKPEIYKSLNSILNMSNCNTNSFPHSESSQRFPPQGRDCDSSSVQTNCNHLSPAQEKKEAGYRAHLSVASSLVTKQQEEKNFFVRSNVSENVSKLGLSEMSGCKTPSMDGLDITLMGVPKSFSDVCCGGQTPLSSPTMKHKKMSATYSVLCSSSSISDSASDKTGTNKYDSESDHFPSNIHNNLTDVICSAKDQNISLCHLDSSAINHNITLYTVSGTYHHGILGPKNSGNGFPYNGHTCSPRRYNIPGVMSCDNIANTKHSPPPMIIRNSCTMHCCTIHEPVVKVDHTIPAYCHPLPIPSLHFSPGLVCPIRDTTSGQPTLPFYSLLPSSNKLEFPKLVSSVSDSGLDTKKMIKCGRLNFSKPKVSIGEIQLITSVQDSPQLSSKTFRTSSENLKSSELVINKKDTGTMTSMKCLSVDHKLPLNYKDAEVQTVLMENKSVATSPGRKTSAHSHLSQDFDLTLDLPGFESPVRKVRWDEEGMTWEVYGASVDPEILGLAIQKHLEVQIEQNLQTSEPSGESNVEQSTKEKRRSIRTVMDSLRQTNCCVRTSSLTE